MPAPTPQFYLGGTGTLATQVTETLDAGTSSASATYDLWNDKGGTNNSDTLKNARLRVEVRNSSLQWVTSGEPPADEQWWTVQLTGAIKTGDPNMADQNTGAVRLGKNSELALGDIPKNTARTISVYRSPGAGASTAGHTWRLNLVYDEASIPLADGASIPLGGGVKPDRLIAGVRRIRSGGNVTANSTDVVTTAKRRYSYDGVPKIGLQTTSTLNQNDGAAAALTAGESYIAVLSQPNGGNAVTATKGNKAVSPTTPTTPANEIFVSKVTVRYQAGGVSIILQSDVDQSARVYGEYFPYARTGLTLGIGAGESISETDTRTFHGAESTLSMTASQTNHVWVNPDGTFQSNTTGTAPQTGSEKLAEVLTGVSSITTVTDKREWADRYVEVPPLTYPGIPAVLNDVSYIEIPCDCYLEENAMMLKKLGAGASSGQFKGDLKVFAEGADVTGAGTTIYTTGPATNAPVIAYNASTLITRNSDHEVTLLTKGQRVRFDILEIPAGTFSTDPQDLKVALDLRRK